MPPVKATSIRTWKTYPLIQMGLATNRPQRIVRAATVTKLSPTATTIPIPMLLQICHLMWMSAMALVLVMEQRWLQSLPRWTMVWGLLVSRRAWKFGTCVALDLLLTILGVILTTA